MKALATVLLLVSASLLCAGSAEAKPGALNFKGIIIATGGDVSIPTEWDGVWTTLDSIYDCSGAVLGIDSGEDTLCAGASYLEEAPEGYTFTVTCKGTADATSAHVICEGGEDVFTDCHLDFVSDLDVVRTGDDYRAEVLTTMTTSGTGMFCDQFPQTCVRIVTYGHRTGPAPPAYCATPTKATTWGEVKLIYR